MSAANFTPVTRRTFGLYKAETGELFLSEIAGYVIEDATYPRPRPIAFTEMQAWTQLPRPELIWDADDTETAAHAAQLIVDAEKLYELEHPESLSKWWANILASRERDSASR